MLVLRIDAKPRGRAYTCKAGSVRVRLAWRVAGFVTLTMVAGCGGGEPVAKAPPPHVEPPAPIEPPMRVEGQLGSMDPRAFDKAFDARLPELQQCHTLRLQRIKWLAGDVKFFLRIGEDGAVRWAFLEDSTLGDRETETCMVQALKNARWPQPVGGEAEVRKSLGFDAPADVRPPTSWASDEISAALVANNAKLRACHGKRDGSFKATAYVVSGPPAPGPAKGGKRPRGKRPSGGGKPHGHFMAIGITPPSREGLESIDCFVDTLLQMPVPSPGSYAAKVTFSL